MEVWLAGTRVQTFSVTSVDWAAYTVTVPQGLQAFSVDLVFANDAYRPDLARTEICTWIASKSMAVP